MKPEKYSIGYVVWEDANLDNRTLHVPDHRAFSLLSAGVIMQNDDGGVTLVQDFSEDGAVREVKFIPKGNIKQVCVLKKDAVMRSPQWTAFPSGPSKTKVAKAKARPTVKKAALRPKRKG